MTPIFLYDGYPISKLKTEKRGIFDILSKNYPEAVKNGKTTRFCGVVCEAGSPPVVFLPYGIDLPKSNLAGQNYTAGQLLMLSIARYGTDNPARNGYMLSDKDRDGAMFIAIVRELADDFLHNGLYSRRVRKRRKQFGKPDWRRTIARQIPFFSPENVPVYAVIETNAFSDSTSNILASIQADTICDIAEKHGWWTGLTKDRTEQLKNIPLLVEDRKQYLLSIRNFMYFLYDDSSIRLAKLLEAYWSTQTPTDTGNFICGISDFSTLWEQMLKSLVRDRSGEWNSRLPFPFYRINGKNEKYEKNRGRMDIVVVKDTHIIVADAKYYKASSADTAPGISDLLKQSYYARSVQELQPEKTVANYFVFPSKDGNGPLEYASFAYDDTKVPDWLEKVECLYVDMYQVMQKYVSRSRLDWIPEAGCQ